MAETPGNTQRSTGSTVTRQRGVELLRRQIACAEELIAKAISAEDFERWITLSKDCIQKAFGVESEQLDSFQTGSRPALPAWGVRLDEDSREQQEKRRKIVAKKKSQLSIFVSLLESWMTAEQEPVVANVSGSKEIAAASLDVFLSHSKKDDQLAGALVDLLRDCLEIPKERIRNTSGPGFRYGPGDDHDEEIRREVYECKVFVGLLTPNSIQSAYVVFELGARWGANKRIAPLMACGVMPDDLPGPLKGKNAFHASKEHDLLEFVEKLATYLGRPHPAMSGVMSKVSRVVELAAACKSQELIMRRPAEADDIPLLIKRWIRGNQAKLSKVGIVKLQEIADELELNVSAILENFERSLEGTGFILKTKSSGVVEIASPSMTFESVPMRKSSRIDGLL